MPEPGRPSFRQREWPAMSGAVEASWKRRAGRWPLAMESSLVPLTKAVSEERSESQLLHLRNGTIRLLTSEGDSGNQ